ncbi:uncharacterized protein CIMG_05284 [Coccidioides immitis RS]|uniref:Endosomal SPRY domain-containing protein n=3 Tax=Coccidioides TaxID=5500 RepID=J3KF83_COCIM|nr:uncharacterized protein CIMG_05284 [Coccidioides immitis RS]XP_003067577.1 hypothetical protein CPC735_065320 [Coccidioides posadasii C735 delta SOWgp]EAS34260.3 hypothetical protein CIMG_05284 [Coccidioides immitis RS]EER25432.1 hypothetical protein CPC735_065320 [Coccidioides posadasii C735 delta SOWgp]QVM05571.1 hypothetical protein D8B26_000277 [Coccidioides posadasii str. Silveira]|eukprot:XP_003067577.1 hypothetical protein CPC735_065320 [Coccidioides posadasii C735 delta SOWgp]
MAPIPPNSRDERPQVNLRGFLLETLHEAKRPITERRALPPSDLDMAHGLVAAAASSSPMEVSRVLTARAEDNTKFHPGEGAVDPGNINMQGLLALFAIIGAAFVLAAIWFFFWAKNGGFVWREGDWEEYKSTVLRRKDSNGRTLTNASKSTDLGGGSIVGRGYRDYDDHTTTVDTETVATGEKLSRGKRLKETAKQKLLRRHKDEQWEGSHDEDMRAYRHEKPARVGGMNREPEGTYHSSEYTGTLGQRSEWTQSEMGETHGETATRYDAETRYDIPDTDRAPNRNVSGFSFTAGEKDTISHITEEHQLRDSMHRRDSRRQSRSRNSQRPRGPRPSTGAHSRHTSPRKRDRSAIPGGYTTPLDMSSISASEYVYDQLEGCDAGVKTYHRPIPGLSKGYRRAGSGRGGRRDSLSDSEGDDYDSRLS